MPDTLFHAVFFTGLVLGWAVRAWYMHATRRNAVAVERGSRLETALRVGAVVAMHVLPAVYVFTPRLHWADYRLPTAAGVAGVLAMIATVVLFWRSHADLGCNWSPVPQIHRQQSLVKRGVFRHVRHPMYAAHWLWGIAQALLLHNWLAGPLFLAFFVPIYFLRVSREERMMLDHFGEEYRLYMGETGQVLPRLKRTSQVSNLH